VQAQVDVLVETLTADDLDTADDDHSSSSSSSSDEEDDKIRIYDISPQTLSSMLESRNLHLGDRHLESAL
jgi:hypothetical protein